MVQDVRSSTTEVVFDLDTESGVQTALAAVRASDLSREDKSDLRDGIFLYTKSGHDTTLLEPLLAKLSGLPMPAASLVAAKSEAVVAVVTPEVVVVPTAPRFGFASGRPQPVFSAPAMTTAQSTVPVNLPIAASVSVPVVETPVAPVVVPSAAPVVEPNDVVVIKPRIVTEPVIPASPAEMVPKEVVDEKLAAVAPEPTPSIELKPPYQENKTVDVYRDRITEIKQFINQKVGNPVNLVDLNNEIGRAYMSALLEAMKAVSGGGGDVEALMAKLESVVKDVEVILKTTDTTSVVPPPLPTPVAAVSERVFVETTVVTEPKQESKPVSVPHKAPQSETIPTPNQIPVTPITPVIPVEALVAQHDVLPMDVATSRFKNVIPVTAQEPLKTPKDLPTAAEVKARSGITDPLQDPDVDLGLEQLLGEWTLFRKSGVFGTGPKGTQHPLFLKLATLPMPLILSGRFEGSTAEIRQSITDYMNGWRYEQGIVYEQDETFEHYLRRVIRHIIDSQTRKRGA